MPRDRDPEPWVPLRDYVEQRFTSEREYLDQRFHASDRALELARTDTRREFEQVNMLRAQVLEERGAFPRIEVFDALRDRVARLERLFPIIALASLTLGAVLTALVFRLFGVKP